MLKTSLVAAIVAVAVTVSGMPAAHADGDDGPVFSFGFVAPPPAYYPPPPPAYYAPPPPPPPPVYYAPPPPAYYAPPPPAYYPPQWDDDEGDDDN